MNELNFPGFIKTDLEKCYHPNLALLESLKKSNVQCYLLENENVGCFFHKIDIEDLKDHSIVWFSFIIQHDLIKPEKSLSFEDVFDTINNEELKQILIYNLDFFPQYSKKILNNLK